MMSYRASAALADICLTNAVISFKPLHRLAVAALPAAAVLSAAVGPAIGPSAAATPRARAVEIANPFPTSGGTAPAYVPGRVIVGYEPRIGAVTAARIARTMGVRAIGPAATAQTRMLRIENGASVAAAVARLRRQPGVAFAEPDYIAHAAGSIWIPNDRGPTGRYGGWESLQWNFMPEAGINAPAAWANLRMVRRPGGTRVIVAILDTGVAYRSWHKFHKSPDFRHTHFVSPHDFVANNTFPLDRNGHGTFVAGIVGESTDNIFGLTGLAYGASIMPVRVLDSDGSGDEMTIARGIRYAVIHHANIINLSLEFSPDQVRTSADIPDIARAIAFAHERGVVVVAAAGNDQTDQLAYPARQRPVISVGATTRDRCLADYSNGGSGLDLVAPGGGNDAFSSDVLSCQPARNLPPIRQLTLVDPPHWGRFGYPSVIGTSMSAPEVAATAALVIASGVIGPNPSPDAILARLEQTAVPLGSSHPNKSYGFGLLDAGAATTPGPPAAAAPATSR
jgi:serine protease